MSETEHAQSSSTSKHRKGLSAKASSPTLSIDTQLSLEPPDAAGNSRQNSSELRPISSRRSHRRSKVGSISDADEIAQNLIRSLENQNRLLASNPKAVLQTPLSSQPWGTQFSYSDLLVPQYESGSERKEKAFTDREIKWFTTWLGRLQTLNVESRSKRQVNASTVLCLAPLLPHERQVAREIYFEILEKSKLGVPSACRSAVWLAMCNTAHSSYSAFLDTFYADHAAQPSPHEKLIGKDVSRTLPNHSLLRQPEHQEMLFRLLKVYSLYDAEVGYCQGLSFVAASLLAAGIDESTSFKILVDLMSPLGHLKALDKPLVSAHGFRAQNNIVHGLRSLYTCDMSGLHSLLFIFNRLVEISMPNVHEHLKANQVPAHMYAGQWFLTLFSYSFSHAIVERLLDVILATGAKSAMLAFALVIVRRLEPKIIEINDFEKLAFLLKTGHLLPNQHSTADITSHSELQTHDSKWSTTDIDHIMTETVDVQQYVCSMDLLQQLEQEWYIEKNKSLELQTVELNEALSNARQISAQKDDSTTLIRREARTLAADLEELQERYKTLASSHELMNERVKDFYRLLTPERRKRLRDTRSAQAPAQPKEPLSIKTALDQIDEQESDSATSSSSNATDSSGGMSKSAAGSSAALQDSVGKLKGAKKSEAVLLAFQDQYTDLEKDLITAKLQLAELQQAKDGIRNRLEHVNRQLSFLQQQLTQNNDSRYNAAVEQLTAVVKSALSYTANVLPKSPLSRRSTAAFLEISQASVVSNSDTRASFSFAGRAKSISTAVNYFIGKAPNDQS